MSADQMVGGETFDTEVIFADLKIDDTVYTWSGDSEDDDYDEEDEESSDDNNPAKKLLDLLNYGSSGDSGLSNDTPSNCQSQLDIEPTAIVNNSVNIISGHYTDFETDFYIPGAEPFILQRSYVSADTHSQGALGKGWSRNYSGYARRFKVKGWKQKYRAEVLDGGALYHYCDEEKYSYYMIFDAMRNSVTNCGTGKISAATDILNNVLKYDFDTEGATFTKSNGEKATYMPFIHRYTWRVTKENKTNGNWLEYTYLDNYSIGEIQAFNKNGTPLDKLTFSYSFPNLSEYFIFIANNGKQKVAYRFKNFEGRHTKLAKYIVEVLSATGPRITYDYHDKYDQAKTPQICRKNKPNGRFQEIEYYRKGSNHFDGFVNIKLKDESPIRDRVFQQKAPVGHDATPIITHKYYYGDIGSPGWAEVFDAYNHKTNYSWDYYDRLKKVERFTGTSKSPLVTPDYKLHSTDLLYWGDVYSDDCTHLLGRAFKDKDNQILYARTFKYDVYGNVLADELFGNLSGKGSNLQIQEKNGKIEVKGGECYGKYHTYTKEDNLFLMTSMQEGEVTHFFEYLKGTDLLVSKLSSSKGKIFKREFHHYDDNAVVVKTIEDDGCSSDESNLEGVTERHIRYVYPRKIFPIGLPDCIKEKYLDVATGKEKLKKKYRFHYSEDGWLTSKDYYDAKNNYLYTLKWEYDQKGNVIKETNALGQAIKKRYDENGNKIYEKGYNKKVYRKYIYDYSDRLIRTDEIHSNGLVLSESSVYNYLSQKIATIDIYGNETQFRYDDLGRLIQTIKPAVANAKGKLKAHKDRKEYNSFNILSKQVDFNGNSFETECNIRGAPTKKIYPDGSMEEFIYNLDGTLQKQIHKNGCYTLYIYDHLKRITSKSTHSQEGKELETYKYEYSVFHLLSETDPSGKVKSYKYDPAGRMIETIDGEVKKTFEYDACGRLFKTVEYDANGGLTVSLQAFDLLDRVIEETREDGKGNCLTRVTYGYDESGNRTTVTNYSDLGSSTTTTLYDNRRQPILVTDPEGNTTRFEYKYDYINEFGQTVPYTISTDSMGNSIESIKDTQGRVSCIIQRNAMGDLIHKRNFFYDKNGNKTRQEDIPTKKPGTEKMKVITLWDYDGMNRLRSITEAAETPEQQQKQIFYNAFGEKCEVIKPDGVSIRYSYDLLGRLIQQSSSDGSIDYVYFYNNHGHLTKIEDRVSGLKTTRQYDTYGRMIKEKQANGLGVEFEYDSSDRLKKVILPDGSGIEYVYKTFRLSEVRRLSPALKLEYSHHYLEYDLEDKLISSQLIGNAGKIEYEYDSKARQIQLRHMNWDEKIISYDQVGNILARNLQESERKIEYSYKYDDLYQLRKEKQKLSKVDTEKHSYRWDSLYNRRSKDGSTMHLNATNQLLDDGYYCYKYDQNGNLIEKKLKGSGPKEKGVIFQYDALDRMIGVIEKNKRTFYTYDAQNRRLSKKTEERSAKKKPWIVQESLRYLYIHQNEIGSYNDKGLPVELRVLGAGKGAEIGAAVAIELKGKAYAPIHDHNGNVCAILNAVSGSALEFYRYSAYGEESIFDGEGNKLEKSMLGNPWRFSSKRADDETGFIFFGRRYYDPSTARWTSVDPIGREGGPNLYAYVLNRPLTSFDCYGLYGVNINFDFNEACNYGAKFFNAAYDFGRTCCDYAGWALEAIAFNFIPIPGPRDLLGAAGQWLQGNPVSGLPILKNPITGDLTSYGRTEYYGNSRGIEVTGMFTTEKDAIERSLKLSNDMGGCNVHYIVPWNDGLILEPIKGAMRLLGISLPGDQKYSEYFQELQSSLHSQEKGVIHVQSHSLGTIMVDNLPSNIKQSLSVTALGGKFLDSSEYLWAKSFASDGDVIPLLCNGFKFVEARISPRSDVRFLKSNELLTDHAYMGVNYQSVTESNGKRIFNLLGDR